MHARGRCTGPCYERHAYRAAQTTELERLANAPLADDRRARTGRARKSGRAVGGGGNLAADGRRVVQQEVARPAGRVVGISDLCSSRTATAHRTRTTGTAASTVATLMAMVAVRQVTLIIGTTTLPTDRARPAAERTVAATAVAVVQTACRTDQATYQAQKHQCALHLRHPLRNPQRLRCAGVGSIP
jgi:hypothetical protein